MQIFLSRRIDIFSLKLVQDIEGYIDDFRK